MFRVMNEYLSKVQLVTDRSMQEVMERFLKDSTKVEKSCINLNYNKYIVDIKLSAFTVEQADVCFREFLTAVAYPYSAMWVRYNEGKMVRYRFVTSKEDKQAVYMDVIFS